MTGIVLEVEEPAILRMTEGPGPSYNPSGETRSSRMNFAFEEVGPELTRLSIVDDEWSEGNPAYESTKDTWPMLFSSLKSYLETGNAPATG